MNQRNILGLLDGEMSATTIMRILKRAREFKNELRLGNKIFHDLDGRTVALLFYENSTRTRTSFEFAGKFLGAQVVNIPIKFSSEGKGETLLDTARTLDAMGADIIVVRHRAAGVAHFFASGLRAHIVNAGDGMHEHPSQALLDMLTLYERFGTVGGLTVAILGDIAHSRVARSNIYGLLKMGATVRVYGPNAFLPPFAKELGAKVCPSMEHAITGADVIMGLRIQIERQEEGTFPSLGEYSRYFGTEERMLKRIAPHAVIMHPGPVNRGVEFTSELVDGENSLVADQVLSGVAVRMAMLSWLERIWEWDMIEGVYY